MGFPYPQKKTLWFSWNRENELKQFQAFCFKYRLLTYAQQAGNVKRPLNIGRMNDPKMHAQGQSAMSPCFSAEWLSADICRRET